MDNGIRILSTRPLSDEIIEAATSRGVDITVLSFIDTASIRTTEVIEEIEHASTQITTVVFTSMNAVEAVAEVLQGLRPEWNIFCIGNSTRKLVERYFGEEFITATANDAVSLAETIIEEGTAEEVIFFCGDQRRNELPELLQDAGIEVTEIIVYETIETPHRLSEEFAAVLFYSPSAVNSFFRYNRLGEHTLAFAIGKTTAVTIQQFSRNRIVIADEPGKDQLAWKAVEMLNTDK
ncbi:uroporphyrinogen-III synthase [Flavihumibacter solisilvae]|uniref:Tetrapyrrole biosynthesis uroporphyrinogen III synthase domain-containing protein n=1 Tax=Flavihumibacter solisilvae TaxID=1349421 RepID=A0A0C1L7F7_9BACT|nr:uroporphyrinogen-III synthase [Flavihumibacter solisilvae]KIC96107.1 hypothetical protein OI18_02775 [Flavihumibacter solisilvae]